MKQDRVSRRYFNPRAYVRHDDLGPSMARFTGISIHVPT